MLNFSVIEWSAWNGFLITFVAPAAKRIVAAVGQPLLPLAETCQPGDVVLLHVNVTRQDLAFPDRNAFAAELERREVRLLNGGVRSIDKWALQDALERDGLPTARIAPEGAADARLVVKTRANHCGAAELGLAQQHRGDIQQVVWPYPDRLVVLRRDELNPRVWSHQGLTVERYVANPAGRFHRAYVLGPYVAAATSHASTVMKEMDHRAGVDFRSACDGRVLAPDDRDPLSVAFRAALAMRIDFAAFDLAEDEDGTTVVIDANVTPFWGNDRNERLIAELGTALRAIGAGGDLTAGAAAQRLSGARASSAYVP